MWKNPFGSRGGHFNPRTLWRQHIILFIHTNRCNAILQQDNTRPHTPRTVSDYLKQQNVNVLPWSAMSPNLSSKERVWDDMERRLHQEPKRFKHDFCGIINYICILEE